MHGLVLAILCLWLQPEHGAQGSPGATSPKTTGSPAPNPDAPLLGHWIVGATEAKGGKSSATLVVFREDGKFVQGYFRWRIKDRPLATEVVSGEFERDTGQLRLRGCEIHSSKEWLYPCAYEARLDATTHRLQAGTWRSAIGAPDTGTWSAQWDDEIPKMLQEGVRREPDTGWDAVCRSASSGYSTSGTTLLRIADRYDLKRALGSENAEERRIAAQELDLEASRDDLTAMQFSRAEMELMAAENAERLLGEIIRQKFSGKDSSSALLRKATDSKSVLTKMQNKDTAVRLAAAKGLVAEGRVRENLRAGAVARCPQQVLDPASIGIVTSIEMPETLRLKLRNTTDKDFHDCLVIVEITTSVDKVLDMAGRALNRDPLTPLLGPLVGIDEASIQASLDPEQALPMHRRATRSSKCPSFLRRTRLFNKSSTHQPEHFK
jgi:hypothetical protein